MKLTLATLALTASLSGAFAPNGKAFATRSSSSLGMSAVETPATYTFTKSEEIFAEAKEVRERDVGEY